MTDIEKNKAAHDRAKWGLLRAILARPEGAPLSVLVKRWRETAATVRADSKDFDDECDTLEHCARELEDWITAGAVDKDEHAARIEELKGQVVALRLQLSVALADLEDVTIAAHDVLDSASDIRDAIKMALEDTSD